MDVRKNIEQAFDMVKQALPAQMEQMGLSDETTVDKANESMQETMELIKQEMSWEKLKVDYISIYAEVFTEDELKGLVAFYKSPLGKKLVEKQPELMQRSMQISQKQMAAIMPKIQELTQRQQKKPPATK